MRKLVERHGVGATAWVPDFPPTNSVLLTYSPLPGMFTGSQQLAKKDPNVDTLSIQKGIQHHYSKQVKYGKIAEF